VTLLTRRPFPTRSAILIEKEPNLESGANIDCCKLYRDNRGVGDTCPSIADHLLTQAKEYERLVKESIKEQLGL
jgi:ubiquitin-conjugating enzyme E2 G2